MTAVSIIWSCSCAPRRSNCLGYLVENKPLLTGTPRTLPRQCPVPRGEPHVDISRLRFRSEATPSLLFQDWTFATLASLPSVSVGQWLPVDRTLPNLPTPPCPEPPPLPHAPCSLAPCVAPHRCLGCQELTSIVAARPFRAPFSWLLLTSPRPLLHLLLRQPLSQPAMHPPSRLCSSA